MGNIYIVSKSVNSNSRRVWGTFKLSDKTKTHFEMKKETGWFQWGNTKDNLCLTVHLVEEICSKWLEENN